ncbi:M23 family metallopeptidase [Aquibacillus koreensis]|uniref:M23 family metallopeptidase n=1 Tax=Aquibacillus koreensis TaxID=279446 RepID=A0A9X3WMI2_9BACI|nr:M23 family metallopeptidase [Aquibacillus koreensis]MCT2535327.1 M23 family metallopeptidase [Aquibacillus koreensis]MDC3422492.1 M23 family metallopeptidase [Aquibacillus koreensis]
MLSALFQIVFIQTILPLCFILMLWKEKNNSKLEWLLKMLTTVAIVAWVFQTGRWDWISYYLRYILLLLLLLGIYFSWKKIKQLPFYIKFTRKQIINTGIYAFLLIVFGIYNGVAITGYSTNQQAIDLNFPLQNGTYYVAHGGNHTQLNYHNAYESQQFALDVVKLNNFGIRTAGFYPKELDKYAIYGETLYSPCDGEIIESRGNLPDLTPSEMDVENPEGNYVALTCDGSDVVIYIAHMQQDSVIVMEGDRVEALDPIGRVGNSGNTSEPHLHIHAEKDSVGIPITFNNEFLVRNSLVR